MPDLPTAKVTELGHFAAFDVTVVISKKIDWYLCVAVAITYQKIGSTYTECMLHIVLAEIFECH